MRCGVLTALTSAQRNKLAKNSHSLTLFAVLITEENKQPVAPHRLRLLDKEALMTY